MSITSRYFIERGTWDDTLEIFINSDGDPSQFAVCPRFPSFDPLCLANVVYTSPYPPRHGTSFLFHSIPAPNVVPSAGL
jgi:hypothetical protein